MLEDELLPNTRVEMNFEIESDGNLIWQAGADCRVVGYHHDAVVCSADNLSQ